MKTIRIKYTDFWRTKVEDFIITRILSKHYQVEIVPENETENIDLLIYSCSGDKHLRYTNCLKLAFNGENTVPNFNECDYAIASSRLDFGDRYLRIPLYRLYPINEVAEPYYQRMLRNDYFQSDIDDKGFDRDFCSLVISNSSNRHPVFFELEEKLQQYKKISYGGKYKNNTGGRVKDKIGFIADYKFNIAFENSAVEGYTTEKIIEPLYARTIPIYWGNPSVNQEIDPRTFINLQDFDSVDQCIEHIIKVDSNPELYAEYFRHQAIVDTEDTYSKLEAFLLNMMDSQKRYRQPYGNQKKYDKKRKKESVLYHSFIRKIYPFFLR